MSSNNDQFPSDVMVALKTIDTAHYNITERPHIEAVTIDAPHSQDLDDAISVIATDTGYQVQVSIADVSMATPIGSPIYQEALKRGQTDYRHDYNIPMLPRALSEEHFSLLASHLRPALTFTLTLSDTLDVKRITIQETLITNRRRLSYEQVDAIINSHSNDPDHEWLVISYNLAQQLLKQRQIQGALALYDLEQALFTNEEGRILPLAPERRHKSHLIVQELMILTNQTVAAYLTEQNIPLLYRNHTIRRSTPERAEILHQFQLAQLMPELLTSLDQKIHLWFMPAMYEPVIKGHFGLNAAAYTHVTSPLRRFPDLINHQIIKAFIHHQSSPYNLSELKALSAFINSKIAQDKKEKSAYLKQKAATTFSRRAARARVPELMQMDHTAFERLLKEACRNDILTDALQTAVKMRLQQNEIDIPHLYTLLFERIRTEGEWQAVEKQVLAFIKKHPHLALQLVNLLPQKQIVSTITVETQPGQHGFFARVVAMLNQTVVSTPLSVHHINKKTARSQAAYHFLAAYFAGTLVSATETKSPYVAPPQPKSTKQKKKRKNMVGRLVELCQKKGWAPAQYHFEQTGTAHQPTFTCICTLHDGNQIIQATGKGKSKKIAKQAAAQQLWQHITKQPAQDNETDHQHANSGQKGTPVEMLTLLCLDNQWPLPEYTHQTGQAIKPIHGCHVQLTLADERFLATGEASTKKEAKRMAAQKLLQTISEHAVTLPDAEPDNNYVGLLNTVCLTNDWPSPLYTFAVVRPSQHTPWQFTVTIQANGETQQFTGSAPQKKEAQYRAASLALQALTPQPEPD